MLHAREKASLNSFDRDTIFEYILETGSMASDGIPVPSVHTCKSISFSIPGTFAFRKLRNISVSMDWNLKVAIYFFRNSSNAGLPI